MVRRSAWAKVNLTLHITGCRPDGYHELESLVVFAGVGDELEFAPAAELTLSVTGPFAPALAAMGSVAGDDNLVLRAARVLRARLSIADGARIRLDKHLPVAAGIGGGSADAAAALRGLNAFWRLEATDRELSELGLGLGADVPACLRGAPLYAAGAGEMIDPAPALPAMGLVLINPNLPVSTAAVFAEFGGSFTSAGRFDAPFEKAKDFAAALSERRNDLVTPARNIEPEINTVLDALGGAEDCLLWRLSGSGATCFGLFETENTALKAARDIAASRPNWWVRSTQFLERAEVPVQMP